MGQRRGPRPVQADGKRRAAAGLQPRLAALRVPDRHLRERAAQLQREPGEAVVGDEDVRAEPHDGDRQRLLVGEA